MSVLSLLGFRQVTGNKATPRQRWGTCCPFDPECEHSFMDDADLDRWLDAPLTDEEALDVIAC